MPDPPERREGRFAFCTETGEWVDRTQPVIEEGETFYEVVEIGEVVDAFDSLARQLAETRMANERLTRAVAWALGYGEWPERLPHEGAFYWRKVLRSKLPITDEQYRAALSDAPEPARTREGEEETDG